MAYTRQTRTSALCGTADLLLDSSSYGARWVLPSPAAAAGVPGRARPPGPPKSGVSSQLEPNRTVWQVWARSGPGRFDQSSAVGYVI
jgi:hypothetical protein